MMVPEPCPEFDCAECGRHIVVLCGVLPEPRLCAACITIPGWLAIPAFREILDPEGYIREPDLTGTIDFGGLQP